ncbi:hypothetical protein ASU85_19720 [Klebsiella aerogenes]|nr:hypothetical protein ASU85_19720 [Klebsiella aerogenes]
MDVYRPVFPLKEGESKKRISFLIFDGVTSQDFIGPATVLSRSLFDVQFVASDLNPVFDDNGLGLVPTSTFSEIKDTDILCVPGTANPYVQIQKKEMIEWVEYIGNRARWVTSVCTGSFILGAAGLLRGYKASAHWTMIDDLSYFGAIPTHERVVKDRNRITGGGVTSGIDFGLTLLAILKGENVARSIQLAMEYDPQPPFKSGSPKVVTSEYAQAERARFHSWLEKVTPERLTILESAAKRLNVNIRS